MKILKKIAGYSLLVIDVLFLLALLQSILKFILNIRIEIIVSGGARMGYVLSTLFVILVLSVLIIYIWKLGLKLIRQKVIIPKETIDDIGSN